MQKTDRELSDVEIIDTYMEILDLVESTYEDPIREDFKKQSRSAQLGYDLLRLLIDKGVIAPGKKDPQQKIDTRQIEEKNENDTSGRYYQDKRA